MADERSSDAVPIRWDDHAAHFELDADVYRLAAVQRTAYRLAARCTALVAAPSTSKIAVTLHLPRDGNDAARREVVDIFFRELLDQELREQVRAETAPVRALLLAVAFSRSGLKSPG